MVLFNDNQSLYSMTWNIANKTSDRPILIFFITNTIPIILRVYVPDNRYAEPIFIYGYTSVFDTVITAPLN